MSQIGLPVEGSAPVTPSTPRAKDTQEVENHAREISSNILQLCELYVGITVLIEEMESGYPASLKMDSFFANALEPLSLVTSEKEASRVVCMALNCFLTRIGAAIRTSPVVDSSADELLRIADRVLDTNATLLGLSSEPEERREKQLLRLIMSRADFLHVRNALPALQRRIVLEGVTGLISPLAMQGVATFLEPMLATLPDTRDHKLLTLSVFSLYRRSHKTKLDWNALCSDRIGQKLIDNINLMIVDHLHGSSAVDKVVIICKELSPHHAEKALRCEIRLILDYILLTTDRHEKFMEVLSKLATICLAPEAMDESDADEIREASNWSLFGINYQHWLKQAGIENQSETGNSLQKTIPEPMVNQMMALLQQLPLRHQEICLLQLLYRGILSWKNFKQMVHVHPVMTQDDTAERMPCLVQALLDWLRWEIGFAYLLQQGLEELPGGEQPSTIPSEINACLACMKQLVPKSVSNSKTNHLEQLLEAPSKLENLSQLTLEFYNIPLTHKGEPTWIDTLFDGTARRWKQLNKAVQTQVHQLNELGFRQEAKRIIEAAHLNTFT